jgi:hypothetical protein
MDRKGRALGLEQRLLLEDPTKSHNDKHRVGENDLFENRWKSTRWGMRSMNISLRRIVTV